MEIPKQDLLNDFPLNVSSKGIIDKFNDTLENDDISPLYINLIYEAKEQSISQSIGHSCRSNSPSELNDYSSEGETAPEDAIASFSKSNEMEVADSYLPESGSGEPTSCIGHMEEIPSHENDLSNGRELQKCIQEEPDNVQHIISLLSGKNEKSLSTILRTAWNELGSTSEKQTFFVAISSNINATTLFCRSILLPWLQIRNSEDVLETIHCIFTWFGSCAIEEVVIPLLSTEESLFAQDLHLLKSLLLLLTDEQRVLITKRFLDHFKGDLEQWHISVLATLLEITTPPSSLIEQIVVLVEINLDDYIQDRNMGKLLLAILQKLTANTPQIIINRAVTIIEKFKGLMRLRLKKLLKTVPKGT